VHITALADFATYVSQAGDTLIMDNGYYAPIGAGEDRIFLEFNGTAAKPVVFKAQSKAGVTFEKSVVFQISGTYFSVADFEFTGEGNPAPGYVPPPVITFLPVLTIREAEHARVCGCNFTDCKSDTSLLSTLKLNVGCLHVEVDNCTFHGIVAGQGITIVKQRPPTGTYTNPRWIHIHHNVFEDTVWALANGQEAIMVGYGYPEEDEKSHNDYYCLIELNIFDAWNGDDEVVSVKANRNVFRNNVVQNCDAHVSNRMGNSNLYCGNVLLNTRHGFRLTGHNNAVLDNDVTLDTGAAYYGIGFSNGYTSGGAITYFPAVDNYIANNIIVCDPGPPATAPFGIIVPPGVKYADAEDNLAEGCDIYAFDDSTINPALAPYALNDLVTGNTFHWP
jgi:hypothetical protein